MGSDLGENGIAEKRLELEALFEQYCEHRSMETIRADTKSMVGNIEGVKLGNVKTSKKDVDEKIFGLKVCQNVKQMIWYGGREMALIIELNIDLNKLRIEHHNASSVELNVRDELETIIAKEMLGAPTPIEAEYRLNVAVYERKMGWDKEWEGILHARLSKEKEKHQKGKTPIAAEAPTFDVLEEKKQKWDDVLEQMKYESARTFLAEKHQFVADLAKLGNAKRELAKINANSAKEVVFNSRVSGFETARSAILNKIKGALGDSPEFFRLLSTRVKLHLTREEIIDPWAASNLSGIVQVLMDTYNKPSFVTFQSTLSSTMSFRCTDPSVNSEPTKVVSEVSGIMNVWANMGFWAYMTRDIFFSVVLVNAMPESPTKEKLMLKLNEHMQMLDSAEEPYGSSGIINNTDSGDLPIFDTITKFLEVIQKSNSGKALKQVAAAPAAPTGQAAQAFALSKNQPVRFRQTAMVAEEGEENEAMAAQQSNGPARSTQAPPPVHQHQPQKRNYEGYKREVARSENIIMELQGGKKIVYTATVAKCAQCAAGNDAHQPSCYLSSCYRCGLFGHTKHLCRQHVSTFVGKESGHRAQDYGDLTDAY